jgi:hypothetical protein
MSGFARVAPQATLRSDLLQKLRDEMIEIAGTACSSEGKPDARFRPLELE